MSRNSELKDFCKSFAGMKNSAVECFSVPSDSVDLQARSLTTMSVAPPDSPASAFPNTVWTDVMRLREESDPEAQRKTLDRLCSTYWQPLFQFARRQGHRPEHAQDLTQGFFEFLLKKSLFNLAERDRGKLRTLLLTAFVNFINGDYQRATAAKRGGRTSPLSLEALAEAESNYELRADENATPEALYDRRCAAEILMAAAGRLERRYAQSEKHAHYESLKQFITVSGNEASYSMEAAKLGIRSDYYRILVQRFRLQFKEALQAQVRETLPENATDAEVQTEVMEIIRLAYE
jgi:DNA-directed RNA polymerase specialized sigma24 family protein